MVSGRHSTVRPFEGAVPNLSDFCDARLIYRDCRWTRWTNPLGWAQWFWHSTWIGRQMLTKRVDGFVAFLRSFYGWTAPKEPPANPPNPLQPLQSDTPLLWGFGKVCILPVGLKELVEDGKVKVVRGSANGIEKSPNGSYTLHYDSTDPSTERHPTKLEADAVVFATGAVMSATRLFSSQQAAELGLGLFGSDDRLSIVKREEPYHSLDEDELRRLALSNPLFADPPSGTRPQTNEEIEQASTIRGYDPQSRVAAPLRLFRGIISIPIAEERDFAVVGLGLISFGGATATQMQAEWVADYFGSKEVMRLPSQEEMMRDASARAVWARRVYGSTSSIGAAHVLLLRFRS